MHRTIFGISAWLVFGIIGAWIATSKGRGGCLWFAICGVSGPIGLILVAVLPSRE